ncbi:HD-GYP domain-containing protein [Thermovibrio sp.]
MPYSLRVRSSVFLKVYLFFSLVLGLVFVFIHFFLLQNLEKMSVYQFKVKDHSEVELLTLNFTRDFQNYNYTGIYTTVNTLLKSDPDLIAVYLYEFSPSNRLLALKRGTLRELPLCKEELLKSPCLYKEIRQLSVGLPVYAEVLYSTQRLYHKFELLKTRLFIVEASSFLILFVAFLVSYFLLRRKTFKVVELLESWQKGSLKEYEPEGNDEFSFIESKLFEMYREIEREHAIDENLLEITSSLLELLIEADDEEEFIRALEERLKKVLGVEVKVIKGEGLDGCSYPVSLINSRDITLCFKERRIPDHFLNILVNVVDMIFLAFREKVEKKKLFFQTITALANAIDATSPWTKGHSQRVAEISVLIGKEMGLSDEELEKLKIAGILHDIGKIGIDKGIIDKPAKLTPQEYEEVKKHSVIGYEVLKPIELLKDVLPAILYHHERCDGSGYPEGLKCDEIPLLARIVAVADVIEAMTAERPYKKAFSFEEVLNHLKENRGKLYDPQVVDAVFGVAGRIRELLSKGRDLDKLS